MRTRPAYKKSRTWSAARSTRVTGRNPPEQGPEVRKTHRKRHPHQHRPAHLQLSLGPWTRGRCSRPRQRRGLLAWEGLSESRKFARIRSADLQVTCTRSRLAAASPPVRDERDARNEAPNPDGCRRSGWSATNSWTIWLAPPRKLVLVDAPVGFGKTTLIAQWRTSPAESRPFAWVSLDPGDNDPGRLWRHVVYALQQACPEFDADDILRAARVQAPVSRKRYSRS